MAEQILVVDDDPRILSMMRRGLIFAGYEVDTAETGELALEKTLDALPDVVILDVGLPGMDGLEVCRRLRAAEPRLPILLLTARDRVPDRVAGLDAGADDYLLKPFAFDELLARIRALLRRSGGAEQPETLIFADLTLNPVTHETMRGERVIDLTLTEY
ncbi:MAG TPA: response regulator transcription factor, partial [Thermomicrobiales bacterium]|nr:response regulator transcription factor [Thermomicrobiales bacterium]